MHVKNLHLNVIVPQTVWQIPVISPLIGVEISLISSSSAIFFVSSQLICYYFCFRTYRTFIYICVVTSYVFSSCSLEFKINTFICFIIISKYSNISSDEISSAFQSPFPSWCVVGRLLFELPFFLIIYFYCRYSYSYIV